jgi:hypothetical protein
MVLTGASGHSLNDREAHDYYATEPKAIHLLLQEETFSNVWEVSCGGGHLAEVLKEKGILGKATDLIDRGYGEGNVDFLLTQESWDGDIITNPPYKYAQQFIERAIETVNNGRKVAMFLRIQFLEGKSRGKMFVKYPPKCIYVSRTRLKCALGGDFNAMTGSATCYAWFVWEKGYSGDTVIKWIN